MFLKATFASDYYGLISEDFQSNQRETFNQLSEGIRNIILRSKELETFNVDMGDEKNDTQLGEDDIPF